MSDPSHHPRLPAASGPSGPVIPPKPPPTYSADRDIHLLDRLAILYRYRRVSGAVFVLTALVLMIQGYSNVTRYEAQARLLIEEERSTAMPGITSAFDAYWEDPIPYYNTQYRILRGRELARRVVRKLQLQNVPEFNGTEPQTSSPRVWLHEARQRLVALVRPAAPAPLEPPKADETSGEAALIGALLSRIRVTPVPDSKLVDVYVQAQNAAFAATAANALVDEYVAQNLEVKQQSTQNMLEWLEHEVAAQQTKVEQSERELASYRDRENAMSLDDKNNIVLSRLNALNDAVLRARTVRIEKEAIYKQIKSGTAPETIPVIAQNPQINLLKQQLTDLQREKARLMERYLEKHPEVGKVNAQLADTERQIDLATSRALQTVTAEYERGLLEERTLAANLEDAKKDVNDLSRLSVSYNVLEREARSNRTVYEALLQRQNELRVSSNSHANNVRVVERAEVPGAPITPTGRRTWLLSLAIGLVAAIAVAYALDYMNDTIKTPDDIARHLKLAFLGLVPAVEGDGHPLLASSHVPHDFGESFRSVRTALISKYDPNGAKILVFTSAQPLEGKTTAAVNVAMALAFGGARVLVIDGDMRRPGLHRPLRLTNERGLSQVLTGQARVRDVIQRTVDPNLLAITAGRTPPNPSELLTSERMKTLLANLVHGPFDWIIIDTPPVLAVTDAVVVAPHVSGVVFVVGAEMTRRRLAERALETVLSTRPKQVSILLNKVDFERNKYYYSRYYGHHYKNYYAQAV
jgi:capsular exopolysaccharide synthesis family protein